MKTQEELYQEMIRKDAETVSTQVAVTANSQTFTLVVPNMDPVRAKDVKLEGLNPYGPCFCGSGKKLKFCHYKSNK